MRDIYNLKSLFKNISVEKSFNESMSEHTSFRIGGMADMIIFPENINELERIVSVLFNHEIPLFLLGSGTNILVRDSGIRGAVVSLTKGFKNTEIVKITEKFVHIVAGAGVRLSKLVKFCQEASLGGLEFLSGIPGSVGGAVVSNAGTKTGEIKDSISSIKIMDKKGVIKIINSKKINFKYRSSNFPKGTIILDAELVLKKTSSMQIERKIEENLRQRQKAQPIDIPSGGSIFKNPDGTKAYKIINETGMRGEQIGGALVSKKHSNFIVNNGNAKASDVIKLINKIRKKVKTDKGITLEPEIVIIGER